MASLEDNRPSIVEQSFLYYDSLTLFKKIKLTKYKFIANHIFQQLDSSNSYVREAAIRVLAALDPKDQDTAIVKLLADPDSEIRRATIESLAALDAKDHISAIVELLADPDSYVRRAAIEELAEFDAKDQINAIVKLLADPDSEIRSAAIKALAALDAKDQVSTISKFLADPESEIQYEAIWALAALYAKDQVNEIAKLLTDPESDNRSSAIGALAELDAKNQISTITKFLADPDLIVQEAAIRALAVLYAKGQVSTITKLLADPDPLVRRVAILALAATLNVKNSVNAIVKLLADQESEVRSEAIESLVALDAKNQTTAIVKLLEDPDSEIRSAAIRALAKLDAKDQVNEIAKLLSDSNSIVQHAAIRALIVLDAKDQASSIAKYLTDLEFEVEGVDSIGQLTAIRALAAFGAKDQVRAITKFLVNSSVKVRITAIRALAALDAKDQAIKISKLLANPQRSTQAVIDALIALGPFSFDNPVFVQVLELSHNDPKEFAKFLFVAHLIGAGKDENEIAITWLGAPIQSFKANAKIDSKEGNKILNVFNKIWHLTEVNSIFRGVLAMQSAKLLQYSNWDADDIPALSLLEDKLRKDEYTIQADFMQKKIKELKGLDWVAFSGKIWLTHALFWLILMTAYPRYPMIQAIFFWNPKVRRIIGMGYVGLLLTWIPYIRAKLFAPFRSSLRSDAMLDEFEASAYFAEYCVRLLPHGESKLIRKTFQTIDGQIILQGDSGQGKTMLLRLLTARSKRIVVFIPAVKCAQGIMAAIQKKLQGAAKDEKFLRNLIYSGAFDIYVDGLNEVSPETRAKISGFAEEYFKANIIMTTQPMEWSYPTTAHSYEIEPLSRDQIEAFLISRKIILAENAPISGDAYETSCRTYLTSYFEQSEEMIKEAQKVLSNPMDLTTVAHMLSLGKKPDLFNLQQQSYQIMANNYKHTNIGDDFPLEKFSELVYQMRLEDESVLPPQNYEQEIACLERHKIILSRQVNNISDEKQLRFRHDKIMDFFIVQTFLGKNNDKPLKHFGDPRFRGVYSMLATLMPLADAQILREKLIDFAVDTKDHTLSDSFIEIVRFRKKNL